MIEILRNGSHFCTQGRLEPHICMISLSLEVKWPMFDRVDPFTSLSLRKIADVIFTLIETSAPSL